MKPLEKGIGDIDNVVAILTEQTETLGRKMKLNIDYYEITHRGQQYTIAKEFFGLGKTSPVTKDDIQKVLDELTTAKEKFQELLASFDRSHTDPKHTIYLNSIQEKITLINLLSHTVWIEAKKGGYHTSPEDIGTHTEQADVIFHELYGGKMTENKEETDTFLYYLDNLINNTGSQLPDKEKKDIQTFFHTHSSTYRYDHDQVEKAQQEIVQEKKERNIRHAYDDIRHFGIWEEKEEGKKFIPFSNEHIEQIVAGDTRLLANATTKKGFSYQEYLQRKALLEETEITQEDNITFMEKALDIYVDLYPDHDIAQRKIVPSAKPQSSSLHEKREILVANKKRLLIDALSIDMQHELGKHATTGASTNELFGLGFTGASYRDTEEGFAKIYEGMARGTIRSLDDLHIETHMQISPSVTSTFIAEHCNKDDTAYYLYIIKKMEYLKKGQKRSDEQLHAEALTATYNVKRNKDRDIPGANPVLLSAYVRGKKQVAQYMYDQKTLAQSIKTYRPLHTGKIGDIDRENIQNTTTGLPEDNVFPIFLGSILRNYLLYDYIDASMFPLAQHLENIPRKTLLKIKELKEHILRTAGIGNK